MARNLIFTILALVIVPRTRNLIFTTLALIIILIALAIFIFQKFSRTNDVYRDCLMIVEIDPRVVEKCRKIIADHNREANAEREAKRAERVRRILEY